MEAGGTDRSSYAMRAAPVDVASRLGPLLFAEGKTALPVQLSGPEFRSELFPPTWEESGSRPCKSSPFNYREQMNIREVKSIPDQHLPDAEALARWIERFLHRSDGRAFVLFRVTAVFSGLLRILRVCRQEGWRLLVQGKVSPSSAPAGSGDDERGVLLGTDVLDWCGCAGNALSNVIVTRLPFAVPDHPLTAARLERIEESGGNPFMNYSVPEAVIKLRQGVGRLIRSSRDRGMVVILDNRVVTRRYGRAFLSALPDAPVEIVDESLEAE